MMEVFVNQSTQFKFFKYLFVFFIFFFVSFFINPYLGFICFYCLFCSINTSHDLELEFSTNWYKKIFVRATRRYRDTSSRGYVDNIDHLEDYIDTNRPDKDYSSLIDINQLKIFLDIDEEKFKVLFSEKKDDKLLKNNFLAKKYKNKNFDSIDNKTIADKELELMFREGDITNISHVLELQKKMLEGDSKALEEYLKEKRGKIIEKKKNGKVIKNSEYYLDLKNLENLFKKSKNFKNKDKFKVNDS